VKPRPPALLAAAVLPALLAAGCLGYRLGASLPPDIRSVNVPTFVNRTPEPLLENETTRAVLRELRKDGTLRVTDADKADATLRVTLVQFELQPLRYEAGHSRAVSEYRIALKAEVLLEKSASGEKVLERKVQGETTFAPAGDLNSAKQAAVPDAATDLAHSIVEAVVEYW
jgi:hypothetical protein